VGSVKSLPAAYRREERRRDLDEEAGSDLAEFFVNWVAFNSTDADEYLATLDRARHEPEMLRYLKAHPSLLAQLLGGGHGR
jgi:hypothetical protein